MASEKTQEWTEATNGAAANATDEWQNVAEEDKIDLTHEGDGFIGKLVLMDTVGANGMVQVHVENVTDLDGNFQSVRAFINAGRDLVNKLRTVPMGRTIRVQWVSSMNTGQITPMRVYSVGWK
jgi:hypothetical protein